MVNVGTRECAGEKIMVKVKDDYITITLPEELDELGRNDELEIIAYARRYRIHKNQIITVDEEDILFNHYGEVVSINYNNIRKMYRIHEPFSMTPYRVLLIFMIFAMAIMCMGAIL